MKRAKGAENKPTPSCVKRDNAEPQLSNSIKSSQNTYYKVKCIRASASITTAERQSNAVPFIRSEMTDEGEGKRRHKSPIKLKSKHNFP
jgi:hypothetical protein